MHSIFKTRPAVASSTRRRTLLLFGAFFVCLGFLLSHILTMQLFSYEYYQSKVLDQITTTATLRATRGTVYDANGNVLAESVTEWRVFLSPVDILEQSKKTGTDYATLISELLAPILGLEPSYILTRAKKSTVIDATLAKGLDEGTYRQVIEVVNAHNLGDMVHTEAYSSRYYPGGEFLCHVLGFTGTDQQGLFGLEYQYNSALTGKDGYYLYAKDANGNEMPGEYVSYVPATDGQSLVTTIDSYLQQQLEYQIQEACATYGAQNRVTGVVMNVNTGAILAMATTNGFDCNDPYTLDDLYLAHLANCGYAKDSAEYKALKSELLYTMWSNKAVSELYEPGSTFKIFTACVGLETGATTMSSKYSCSGALSIGGYNISCHKKGGHGSGFSFAYGLQNSCNPTMMTVAAAIGAEKFYKYYQAFGYLEKTGIDLPSEAKGIFHSPTALGTTELATASFGQRFKVSIIQQLTMVACAANGGRLVTPYVVDQIVDSTGTVVYQHETEIKRQVISEETSRLVAECLEAGVSGNGGAKNAYVAGYKVAAKTGTSQKFDILDENGNSYLRVGSCVAFAPSDDPELAVIIVVDEPQNGTYGSMVAAPYISAFLTNALPYLKYQACPGEAETSVTLSDYIGISKKEATNSLKKLGLDYRVIGKGDTVLSQVPHPGTELNLKLGCVILYTEEGQEEYVTVPKVVGLDAQTANTLLLNAGLNIQILGVQNYYLGQSAVVVYQSVESGLKVKRGTAIGVTFLHTDDKD